MNSRTQDRIWAMSYDDLVAVYGVLIAGYIEDAKGREILKCGLHGN